MISFAEWKKAELKAARIVSAEEIPGKGRLYSLKISLGPEERQIVAGIRPFYSAEELKGKSIVVVSNLEPATIAGIKSEAMLLAAKSPEGSYKLVEVDSSVEPGTQIE